MLGPISINTGLQGNTWKGFNTVSQILTVLKVLYLNFKHLKRNLRNYIVMTNSCSASDGMCTPTYFYISMHLSHAVEVGQPM